VIQVIISVLLRVDVNVGAVPPGHLKLPGHVTDLAVPSAVNVSINDPVEPEVGILEIVNVVIAALSDTSNIVAVCRSKVSVPAEMVGAARVDAEFTG
jgi:hypothetical protein